MKKYERNERKLISSGHSPKNNSCANSLNLNVLTHKSFCAAKPKLILTLKETMVSKYAM